MGIYFMRCCPNCNFILEYFKGNHFEIRSPYLDCPACGAKIRHDNLREWCDLNSFGKAWHIFTHICMSVLCGLILINVALWITVGLLDIDSSEIGSRNLVYTIVIVAVIIGTGILFIIRAICFIKRIKESLIRTRKLETGQNLNVPITLIRMGSEID